MPRSRRGFTLIEMLVVIAVIATLVGLLLPAVQRTRESASRTKCSNNLKQISLACHLYENTRGHFPPSRRRGEVQTWAWLILPQLEQDNLYKNWPEGGQPIGAIACPDFLKTPVPVYFCPSRRQPGEHEGQAFAQPLACGLPNSVPGAVNDYAACIGTTGDDGANEWVILLAEPNPPNGMFRAIRGVRTAEVTDGLSNTILVGEKHIPYGQFGNAPWDCNTYDAHNIACSTRPAGPGFPLATSRDDTRWLFGGPHLGLCMFAFADGSVKPVRTTIDERALGLLSQRNDNQPTPSDY